MAIRNIARGGGKQYKPIVEQLKDLEKKFRALQDVAAGEAAGKVIVDAAKVVFDQAENNARAANIPHEALQDLFYTKSKATGRRGISALVGLRKRGRNRSAHGYVEWHASMHVGRFQKRVRTKKGKALVMRGKLIGENLGTMWELGTTKMAPRPWFRTAVQSARGAVTDKLTEGYRRILAQFGK